MATKTRNLTRPLQAGLAGLVGVGLALLLWLLGALEPFEARTWDLRERLFARPGPATSKIVTILLDQASLDWVKDVDGLGWPWPRELYSAMVDFCARGGAKALVLDVLFTEPSTYGQSDDERLAEAIHSNGSVVGAMLLGSQMANLAAWPPDLARPKLAVEGLDAWLAAERPSFIGFPRAQFPIPELSQAYALLANTDIAPDTADGVYRRAALFSRFDGAVVPSEALAAYLVGNKGEHRLSIGRGALVLDGRSVPIDSDGRAILRFRGPSRTHRAYSARPCSSPSSSFSKARPPTSTPRRSKTPTCSSALPPRGSST